MNLTELARDIGLDETQYAELLELFARTSRSDVAAIKEAVAAGDAHRAICASHSIKGASANLGLEEIRNRAETIEALSHNGRLKEIGGALRELETGLAGIERSLTER
ncbi:MAG: Hpt domain-containing protein [Candidatus Krumholzibacteria bacterium]|nr:Hpt domain-containing protein [Candidatus Krumholzibacteria bacterium]